MVLCHRMEALFFLFPVLCSCQTYLPTSHCGLLSLSFAECSYHVVNIISWDPFLYRKTLLFYIQSSSDFVHLNSNITTSCISVFHEIFGFCFGFFFHCCCFLRFVWFTNSITVLDIACHTGEINIENTNKLSSSDCKSQGVELKLWCIFIIIS